MSAKIHVITIFTTLLNLSLHVQIQEPFAWCIVPFDKMERTPEERIKMLQDLGINTYAYDWREKHLPEMEREFNLAQKNDIKISAVWMWIDPKVDDVDHLGVANERVLKTIEKTGLSTTLWVSFHRDFFKGLSEAQRVQKGAVMLYPLYRRCQSIGCKLALYNHGDWFGNPENQIKIIKLLGLYDIGLVYSFHHGHQQIKQFKNMVKNMMPFLAAVNLNGMKKDGPQIYPLGQGDDEKEMLNILIKYDYKGPFGILGHKEDADVRLILEKNLEGYHKLMQSN